MAVQNPTLIKTYFQTGDKPTQAQFVDFIDSAIPALVYRALISQAATDPPTAIVLENTLGEIPTFSYDGQGAYSLVVSAAIFTANKTFVIPNTFPDSVVLRNAFAASRINANVIALNYTRIDTMAGEDGALTNGELQILIFP